MSETDHDYYERRAAEELARAQEADTDVARLAHRALADLYRARLTSERDIERRHV
jgi:hypothetical protein